MSINAIAQLGYGIKISGKKLHHKLVLNEDVKDGFDVILHSADQIFLCILESCITVGSFEKLLNLIIELCYLNIIDGI